MSYKQVKELRQAGKLEEALSLAIETLDANPNDIWNKRSIGWVYYAYLKKNEKASDFQIIIDYLGKIKELDLPETEKMIFDNCSWAIGIFLFDVNNNNKIDVAKVISIFQIVKDFSFTKPSDSYSFMLKAFQKALSQSYFFIEVADWWGFEHFRDEDYFEPIVNDKKSISLVENAYIQYAKLLLDGNPSGNNWQNKVVDKDRLSHFLVKLNELIDNCPNYQYPPYYKAKILLALGNEDNALSAFLPFAKQKINNFWVWELLGDIVKDNPDLKFACYCKALKINTPDEFLIKLRHKFTQMLISRRLYSEAKTEIEKNILIKEKNKWKISNEILNWKTQEWYINSIAKDNNLELYSMYEKEAEELLYSGVPEDIVVVSFVNHNKQVLNFVKDDNVYGFFKYAMHISKPKVGQLLKVRFNGANKDNQYKVLTVKNTDVFEPNLIKEIEGCLSIKDSNNYGFINDVFVEPQIVEKNKLQNGQMISVKAVKSYNKSKNSIGWKCIEIINNEKHI